MLSFTKVIRTLTPWAAIALSACNLFSPLASSSAEDAYRSRVLDGNEEINRGNYSAARSAYEKAIDAWPKGSEAWLYHAKAVLKEAGLDYDYLNGEFDRAREGGRGVPFVDSTSTTTSVDSIYAPIFLASRDLMHILRGNSDTIWLTTDHRFYLAPDGDTASDGVVSAGVAQLDIGLIEAIRGMLAALDMDYNGHIDSACGMEICADTSQCAELERYRDQCPDGRLSEAWRLESYKMLTADISLDSLSSADVNAKDVSNNPADINAFLDAMLGPTSGSNLSLGAVDSTVTANSDSGESFQQDINSIAGNVSDLAAFLGYMRHNDSADNDGDAGASGARMRWSDFDKDGQIRFDYDENLGNLPRVAGNIGHPLHRKRHPELYLTMDEFLARTPSMLADTGENSRRVQMIRQCRKLADKVPADSSGLGTVCETISAALKPSVKPPARSDWLDGTFGIDEETLDGLDNDCDGLQDEDSRQYIGLDDDNDAVFPFTTPGTIEPMKWTDEDGDGCIDIERGGPTGRAYCIGTLEHRLRLARNAPDSLADYYSPVFEEDSLDAIDECVQDIRRAGISDNWSSTEQQEACHYKHIWIAARPVNSEWTAGFFGVDEEKADGIDNDGDGWIDEDLDVTP